MANRSRANYGANHGYRNHFDRVGCGRGDCGGGGGEPREEEVRRHAGAQAGKSFGRRAGLRERRVCEGSVGGTARFF